MRSLLPLLYLLLVWTKHARTSDPNLPFMEYLDQNHLVCLKWGFDDLEGEITLKFVVNTTGWIGFGFSPNGGMAGADIIMGGIGPSGTYFKDYHATGNSMPKVDEKQSYTLLSATESEGQTILTCKRAIQTCDDQDFHITTQAIKLIYAYGTTDQISYHSSLRGTKEVNLLNYKPKAMAIGTTFHTVTVDNITVPSDHTYYHCKVMKFPKLKTKHHIYLVEPVIEHHDLIHHMLLYRCPFFVTEEYDRPCYMGDIGDACFDTMASWAVGGGVYALPDNVGIPYGGEETETLFRLEIHYNNPNGDIGRTDSSGLKLYYTDKLRKHDVGTLTVGLLHVDGMDYKIPPKASQFHSYGVCNTSIFSQLVNPFPELNVFSVLLHTHLAGRKVRLAHFRGGKQIDFLGIDENYNFELQQPISFGKIKTIKLGDELVVECTYSTSSRNKATKMGLGTNDEMCLAFLLYYPEVKITSCISHPNTLNPAMSTSNQVFQGTTTQSEIADYERLLKSLPQIQIVTDANSNYSIYDKGVVRELMKTPTVACRSTSGSSRHSPSWIMRTAGILLLLRIAVL